MSTTATKQTSQRRAHEYKRALLFLTESVEREKRTHPFSLNVRDGLARANELLKRKAGE